MAWTAPPPAKTDGQVIPASVDNTFRTNILELQDRLPKWWTAVGASGTTSGTGELTVATVNIPAQPVAGALQLTGRAYIGLTVGTDDFRLRLKVNGVAQFQTGTNQANPYGYFTAGPSIVNAPAATAHTITMVLLRVAGTGNGQVFGDSTHTRIDVLWIPGAP